MRSPRTVIKTALTLALLVVSFLSTPSLASAFTRLSPLDAGGSTTCALRSGNDVYCVGDNGYGQLGDGTFVSKSEPVFAGVRGALAVSVGKTSACAIGADQKGYCWGDNSKGQLGNATAGNLARAIDLSAQLIDISVGDTYACAVTVTNSIYCWGEFVGFAETKSSSIPVLFSNITSINTVSVGKTAVCFTSSSDAYCSGPLVGTDQVTKIDRTTGVTQVAVGSNFACALITSAVRCWGDNSQGQLGVGNANSNLAVVDVAGISDAKSLVVGDQHACALSLTGTTYCWGDNASNQITAGGLDQLVRVPTSLASSVYVTAGSSFTCSLLLDASIKCLGDNSKGQSALLTSSITPLLAPAGRTLSQVSSGATTTCGIDSLGSLQCWGDLVPEFEQNLLFSQVAVGYVSACAISTSGDIWCWGNNSSGQLGDNSNRTTVIPTMVNGLGSRNARSLSAGYRHFCAAMDDGLVMCWGDNSKDQLGYTGVDSKVATPVSGIGNATTVSVGDYHSCALLSTNKVMCWGDNSKRQITSDAIAKVSTLQISLSSDVQKVIASGYNTCYLLKNSTATCRGDNSESQAAETIAGTYSDLSVGGKTVCLIKAPQGTVTCLGSNTFNKLGRVGLKSATPVDVDISATTIAVGAEHVCAVLTGTKQLGCWGSNSSGQLGSSFGFPAAYQTPIITLTGKANVGESLTATLAEGESSAEYSWYRSTELNGTYSKLSSQTSKTIALTASDANRYYKAYIVLHKFGTSSKVFKSPASAQVGGQIRLLLTPTPTVSGTAKVGSYLRVSTGRWETSVKLTFQWYRGSSAIKGATTSSYKLSTADVGKQISVAVIGTKTGLPKVTKRSTKSAKVVR